MDEEERKRIAKNLGLPEGCRCPTCPHFEECFKALKKIQEGEAVQKALEQARRLKNYPKNQQVQQAHYIVSNLEKELKKEVLNKSEQVNPILAVATRALCNGLNIMILDWLKKQGLGTKRRRRKRRYF